MFLDQLPLWDRVTGAHHRSHAQGPQFDPTGCVVRRVPPAGSVEVIDRFLAAHHYAGAAGMRGLPIGLYRGDELLGLSVYSRVARPRWAEENFAALRADRTRSDAARRHLRVTEAEYAALSRFALAPGSHSGPLGGGAASWFLSRSLAWLEARNRALWVAHCAADRGVALDPAQRALVREAERADDGRGRGYVKACLTHADPWQGHVGHIYQVLNFHYCGRTNRGLWTRERVGARSGRRLSARTLAKAAAAAKKGHAPAALRLAWEGGEVMIDLRSPDGSTQRCSADWIRGAAPSDCGEAELTARIRAAWRAWRAEAAPRGWTTTLSWVAGTGVVSDRFPPKHAYMVGLGAPWYRRQIEVRHRPLTQRLLAEGADVGPGLPAERRRVYYPSAAAAAELRPELRAAAARPDPSYQGFA